MPAGSGSTGLPLLLLALGLHQAGF